jgi:hypothetical protein
MTDNDFTIFLNGYRNDAYYISLERLEKCETFLFTLFFQIQYDIGIIFIVLTLYVLCYSEVDDMKLTN